MSAVSDLVNGWPGGIIQASRDEVFVSPLYLVTQLYAEARGSELLSCEARSPTFDSSREGKAIPYLDVVASRSADGKQIFIKAVNSNLKESLSTTITINGTRVGPRVLVASISSGLEAFNSFSTPNAVQIRRSRNAAKSNLVINLPARSVSVFTLTLIR